MPAPSQPNAPTLRAIQEAIGGAVMRPLAAGEQMQRNSRGLAEEFIKRNDRLTSSERLQIYNQQYWWRILSSFGEDFRGLRAVLGERKFEKLAIAYIQAVGSTTWSLRDLGQALVEFLTQLPQLTAPHQFLALDMAKVEWARVVAFDGAEKPVLEPAKLGRGPEKLKLRLQPYVSLLELSYPVDQLLGSLRKREIETGSASNAVSGAKRKRPIRLTAPPAEEPLYLAVHRVEFTVYYKRLDREAWQLLTSLREGRTLADACAAAFASSPFTAKEAAAHIQSWFASWTRLRWLCAR